MNGYQSTKILELGSCAFRQPNASHSHCRFIHGYKLSAKFWFEANTLDHTTCIAADDPVIPIFEELAQADACDLRIMPSGTGIERIAEWCLKAANRYVAGITNNRCKCIKTEVFEHENNSAIYTPEMTPSIEFSQ